MTELPIDSFFLELSQGYNDIEIAEIKRYLTNWHKASYVSIAHNILDHSQRKRIDPLKFLRKAHNFHKKGAIRVPKRGFRRDDSAIYRKGNEYLIVRLDQFGVEKIVTYGVNNE